MALILVIIMLLPLVTAWTAIVLTNHIQSIMTAISRYINLIESIMIMDTLITNRTKSIITMVIIIPNRIKNIIISLIKIIMGFMASIINIRKNIMNLMAIIMTDITNYVGMITSIIGISTTKKQKIMAENIMQTIPIPTIETVTTSIPERTVHIVLPNETTENGIQVRNGRGVITIETNSNISV